MPLKRWPLAAVMLVLAAQPLWARSHDDVLAGMFRCAAISDTRTWLDCFYGAAQPLRAELGLQPAPPSQVRLSQNPPAGNSPAGDLAPRYQATAGALRCNNLTENREWLNCYYGAAQPVRAQLGLSSIPQPPPLLASAAQPNRAISTPANPGNAAFAPGWLQMASYRFNRYGIFTLALGNGQQWQQLSGDTNAAHWKKPAPAYWVRISRGALRSLNLRVKGETTVYKVEKID